MIYSEMYAKEIHKPATEGTIGDLHVFMDNIALNVQPTLLIRVEPDHLLLAEKYSDVIKRAFKNR